MSQSFFDYVFDSQQMRLWRDCPPVYFNTRRHISVILCFVDVFCCFVGWLLRWALINPSQSQTCPNYRPHYASWPTWSVLLTSFSQVSSHSGSGTTPLSPIPAPPPLLRRLSSSLHLPLPPNLKPQKKSSRSNLTLSEKRNFAWYVLWTWSVQCCCPVGTVACVWSAVRRWGVWSSPSARCAGGTLLMSCRSTCETG